MQNTFSIAFYNLENLFDTVLDEYTLDKDYTPDGKFQWTQDRYVRKIQNLGKAISKIGLKKSKIPPVFIGVAEVESDICLEDLIHTEKLLPFDYDFVHYNSPDERGIDVAFLYQKKHFKLIYSDTYTLYLTDDKDNRDYTRDILLISGILFDEQVYIIINHWPSRNNGVAYSENKRVKAAQLVQQIIDGIYNENEDANIIIMGDFNDEPFSNSIKNHLMTTNLHNLMLPLQENHKGSVNYHGKWFLFDQIMISDKLLDSKTGSIRFRHGEIFDEHFLQDTSGKRKGHPKRTFLRKWHLGGFSDHFPVLAYFQKII